MPTDPIERLLRRLSRLPAWVQATIAAALMLAMILAYSCL